MAWEEGWVEWEDVVGPIYKYTHHRQAQQGVMGRHMSWLGLRKWCPCPLSAGPGREQDRYTESGLVSVRLPARPDGVWGPVRAA